MGNGNIANVFLRISDIFLWELWNGPIKVNLEFSFSFFGYLFSGLEPSIYFGFKPEIWVFNSQFQPKLIFHFPDFQILNPKRAIIWFTLIGPMSSNLIPNLANCNFSDLHHKKYVWKYVRLFKHSWKFLDGIFKTEVILQVKSVFWKKGPSTHKKMHS